MLNQLDFDGTVNQEVARRGLQVPVLALVILVCLLFAAWKVATHHQTGSATQAAWLVRTNRNPAYTNFTGGTSVQAVHCTTATSINRLGSILREILPNTGAGTSYDCTGTSTGGEAMYWCVAFPNGNSSPRIQQEYGEGMCHN